MRIEKASYVSPIISYTWQPSDGENIITVVNNDIAPLLQQFPSLGGECWCNGYLTELRATGTLTSIPEAAPLTTSPDKNTDAEILADSLNSQWNSARVHLGLWTTNKQNPANQSDWDLVGFTSMQNSAFYPFEFYEPKRLLTPNLAYELGGYSKIGLSVMSVMFDNQELMLTAADSLTFRGSFRQELFSLQPDTVPVYVLNQGTTQAIQQRFEDLRKTVLQASRLTVFDARTNRINGLITNTSASGSIFVKEGNLVTSTDFTYAITAGASRAVNAGYNGIVTAISQSGQVPIQTQETYNVPVTQ